MIVKALLTSSEGCNGQVMSSELSGYQRKFTERRIHRAGQRLVLALIGSGSDYGPDTGWKTLAVDGSIRL